MNTPEVDTELERGELVTAVEIIDNVLENTHYLKSPGQGFLCFCTGIGSGRIENCQWPDPGFTGCIGWRRP